MTSTPTFLVDHFRFYSEVDLDDVTLRQLVLAVQYWLEQQEYLAQDENVHTIYEVFSRLQDNALDGTTELL